MEKRLLKGIRNFHPNIPKTSAQQTKVVTTGLLRVIRENLSRETLAPLTAQAIWSGCLLGFWGAFRLGELFPPDSCGFDRNSGLLWEDVEFAGQTIKLHIKSAKIPGSPGNLAVIFPVRSKKLCPIVALRRLQASQNRMGLSIRQMHHQTVFSENSKPSSEAIRLQSGR